MQKRLHLTASGRVQGVFFRHSAKELAERLGLTGWARNTAEGGVEIVAEGEEAALKEFFGWAQKGPPLARVDDIHVEWSEATGELEGFEIV